MQMVHEKAGHRRETMTRSEKECVSAKPVRASPDAVHSGEKDKQFAETDCSASAGSGRTAVTFLLPPDQKPPLTSTGLAGSGALTIGREPGRNVAALTKLEPRPATLAPVI